jgi:dTDP-4-amino-4,6-dideoxygalactose transaminase
MIPQGNNPTHEDYSKALDTIARVAAERDDYKNHFEACEAQRQRQLAELETIRAERDKLLGFYTEIVKELGDDCALQLIGDLRSLACWLASYVSNLNDLRYRLIEEPNAEKCKEHLIMHWPIIQGTSNHAKKLNPTAAKNLVEFIAETAATAPDTEKEGKPPE